MLSKEAITAFQRYDSRGNPTVMARIRISDNGRIIDTRALVPSGASKGTREALELRDGGKAFHGMGVSQAVENVSEIARAISGLHVTDQVGIDYAMKNSDGTENKSRLGANAMLAVSLAAARAGAEYSGVHLFEYLSELAGTPRPTELPTPLMNFINGGAHADNGLPFQEFMIVPVGARNFAHAMQMGAEVYKTLGKKIKSSGVGDEGGYSPIFPSDMNVFQRIYRSVGWLGESIEESGYQLDDDIAIALDVAASEFYKPDTTGLHTGPMAYWLDEKNPVSAAVMNSILTNVRNAGPVVSIEDGMAEGDIEGWKLLTQTHGGKDGIQIVGDDLFVTNPYIFAEGIEAGLGNAILVKLNQIGTLTETLQVIRMAKERGYNAIISHRSGETEDTFIADLAVATGVGQIKTGSLSRSERLAKYHRLLDIEQIWLPALGLTPTYAGKRPFGR